MDFEVIIKSCFRNKNNKTFMNWCHFWLHRHLEIWAVILKQLNLYSMLLLTKGKTIIKPMFIERSYLKQIYTPDIVHRFKIFPIGLSENRENAFLQLSIAPNDRDYLRLFYPFKEVIQIYRQCHVMFGVTWSPYLLNAFSTHLLENSAHDLNKGSHSVKKCFL